MRCLGIDYGMKRIGLAISDPSNTIARSYGLVINGKKAVEQIREIVEREGITHLVFGLPLHMSGDKGDKALLVEEFAEKVRLAVGEVEVLFEDERLTTVTAQRVLIEGDVRRSKRKEKIDALAASLILQKYLDRIK